MTTGIETNGGGKPASSGVPLDCIVMRKILVSITPNNDIPAFAGYLSGSVREPEAKIILNFEAMVNSSVDPENEISFEEIFTTSVVHEMLHAVQDWYGRVCDEEEVEKVLLEASQLHYGDEA